MSLLSRRSLMQASVGASLLPAAGLLRSASAQTVMGDAYSVMAADPRFITWVRLIDAGGLQQYARAPVAFTVFPPTEIAFAKFPNIVRDLLGYQTQTGSHNAQDAFPDTAKIVKLVRSHVVAGKHLPAEAMGHVMDVTSVAGTPIHFDGTKNPVTVTWRSVDTGQTLTAPLDGEPIICVNAVIYPVDDIYVG